VVTTDAGRAGVATGAVTEFVTGLASGLSSDLSLDLSLDLTADFEFSGNELIAGLELTARTGAGLELDLESALVSSFVFTPIGASSLELDFAAVLAMAD
jgi:hypothetical protein